MLGYLVHSNCCAQDHLTEKTLLLHILKGQGTRGQQLQKGSSNHFVISFKTNFILGRDVKLPKFWNEEILIDSHSTKTNLKWKSKVASQGDNCFPSGLMNQSHLFLIISHACSIALVKINNCPSKNNVKDELFCIKIWDRKDVYSFFFFKWKTTFSKRWEACFKKKFRIIYDSFKS